MSSDNHWTAWAFERAVRHAHIAKRPVELWLTDDGRDRIAAGLTSGAITLPDIADIPDGGIALSSPGDVGVFGLLLPPQDDMIEYKQEQVAEHIAAREPLYEQSFRCLYEGYTLMLYAGGSVRRVYHVVPEGVDRAYVLRQPSCPDDEEMVASAVSMTLRALGAYQLFSDPTTADDSAIVVERRRVPIPPKAKKGAVKLPRSSVSVIDVRRDQQVRYVGEAGHRKVEHDHRWEVRGHYRRQRVGKGRAEEKVVWIEPQVRGPEDKPLVRKSHVYRIA